MAGRATATRSPRRGLWIRIGFALVIVAMILGIAVGQLMAQNDDGADADHRPRGRDRLVAEVVDDRVDHDLVHAAADDHDDDPAARAAARRWRSRPCRAAP